MAGRHTSQRCVPGNEAKNITALLMLLNKNALSRMIKVRTFDRGSVCGESARAADRFRDACPALMMRGMKVLLRAVRVGFDFNHP